MITELVLGVLGVALLKARQKSKIIAGIGRVKRRVYVEVSKAQDAGIDFAKKYLDLTEQEKNILTELGERFQYKQTKRSIETGKAYAESYFNSLRRAWNAVSGVYGIGAAGYTDYKVRNREGNIALIYRQYADAIDHVQQEKSLEDLEEECRKLRNHLRRKGYRSADFALPATSPKPLPAPQEITEDEHQQMMEEVYVNQEMQDALQQAENEKPKRLRDKRKSAVSKKTQERIDKIQHAYEDFLSALDFNKENTAIYEEQLQQRFVRNNPEFVTFLEGVETMQELIEREFVDGRLLVKGDVVYTKIDGKPIKMSDDIRIVQYAEYLLGTFFKPHKYMQFHKPPSDNNTEKKLALLARAPHMAQIVDGDILRGDDRTTDFNYVIWRKTKFGKSGDFSESAQYPIFATKDFETAEKYAFQRGTTDDRGFQKSKDTILTIDEVNLDAISGLM